MPRRSLALGLGLVAVGAGVVPLAVLLGTGRSSHPAAPEQAAGSQRRTVLVADSARPLPRVPPVSRRDCIGRPRACLNGAEGLVLAYSLRGAAPAGPADGVVLTDENCEPDRNGISHCLNSVRLDAGGTLTVRHDHAMHDDPCLSPGERVRVVSLASYLRT